jgi:hypothetical protein
MLAKVVNKMGLGLDIDEEPLFLEELTEASNETTKPKN